MAQKIIIAYLALIITFYMEKHAFYNVQTILINLKLIAMIAQMDV